MSEEENLRREFDILEMPKNGVAAYWLSVKKIMDKRKGPKIIGDEIAQLTETFVKRLLEFSISGLDDAGVRDLTQVMRDGLLAEYGRKFELMRICACSVASNENPRRTLIRMNSLFPVSLVNENQTIEMVNNLLEQIKANQVDLQVFADVDHNIKSEQLMLKLIFYVVWARREGRAACQKLLAGVRSRYFADGLALALDGFEESFVRRSLQRQKRAILYDAAQKMDMSLKMCLGIKNRLSYEDIFKIAKAFIHDL